LGADCRCAHGGMDRDDVANRLRVARYDRSGSTRVRCWQWLCDADDGMEWNAAYAACTKSPYRRTSRRRFWSSGSTRPAHAPSPWYRRHSAAMEPLGDGRGESVSRRCMCARLRGDISSVAGLRVNGRNVDRFSALRSPPRPRRSSSGLASTSSRGSSAGVFLGRSGSGSGGGRTSRRSRLARCVRVLTELGLAVVAVAVTFGLSGDGRLWRSGAATAAVADMAGKPNSSSTWSSCR
jgi:hypothetical protein